MTLTFNSFNVKHLMAEPAWEDQFSAKKPSVNQNAISVFCSDEAS